MTLCAIDVGTNTVQSLVAEVEGGAVVRVLADEERFARLGQGVDASGRLHPDAMDRVVDRLGAAQATADRLGAERVVIGATSASRDAANVGELVARVRHELGLDYTVISGVDEAALSFRGALAALPGTEAAVVVDIGGGSTEIVRGTASEGVAWRTSLDVGSVRLTERHFSVRPPPESDLVAAEADVAALMATVPDDLAAGLPLVATGSVARLFARLSGAEGEAPKVSRNTVTAWRERLAGLAPEAALAIAPDVMAGREDVAAAAVLILDVVMRELGAEAYVATPGGLRYGLALAAADA
ncbi:MAG: exopolyphosphatase [Bacteroidota bacterium]